MRAWYLLLIAIPLVAIVEYQVVSLGNRVDTLFKLVQGISNVESTSGEHAKHATAGDIDRMAKDLNTLSEKVERLQYRYQGAAAQGKGTGPGVANNAEPPQMFDQKVLTVMRDEGERIRDTYLARNRDAMVNYRSKVIKEFAVRQGLSAGQESALNTILEDEVDRMVEIAKGVDWEGDTSQFMVEWMEMIKQTNDKAQDVLNADQMSIFLYLRHLEQQAMVPWLPK